jgi:hypothetical protein
MAPNISYPDHDHAPEEVCLVLSWESFAIQSSIDALKATISR